MSILRTAFVWAFLLASILAGASAQALDDAKSKKFVLDLGTKIVGPLYQKGDVNKYIGFTVDVKKLKIAIAQSATNDEKLRNLLDEFDAKKLLEVDGLWIVNQVKCSQIVAAFDKNSDTITVVSPCEFPIAGRFEFGVNMKALLRAISDSEPVVDRETVWHGTEKEDGVTKVAKLKFKPSRELTISSSLAPVKSNLVTYKGVEYNEKEKRNEWVPEEREMTIVSVTYNDPIFRFGEIGNLLESLFGTNNLNLNFKSSLSDNRLDSRSSIQLTISGVSRRWGFGELLSVGEFTMRTSQSFMQNDVLFTPLWRFNDIRGGKKDKKPKEFFLDTGAGRSLFFDFGAELGYSFFGDVKKAMRTPLPGEKLPQPFFTRPTARLTFEEDALLGGLFTVSGTIQVWYIDKDLSGLKLSSPFAERAELSFAGKIANSKIKFSVKAGRNPSEKFSKIKPVYELTFTIK